MKPKEYAKNGSYGCVCMNCDRALPAIPLRRYKTHPEQRPYTVRRKQCCGLTNLIDVLSQSGSDAFKYRQGYG